MSENDRPYKVKEEHSETIQNVPEERGLDASKYHKTVGGTIVPQTTEFGGVVHAEKQEIPIQEVTMPAEGDVVTQSVGVYNKQELETPSESIAPSGLVASVSHKPGGFPPNSPKRELFKVTMESAVFGKVVIPVVETLLGDDCTVLVTDSSDGFIFTPPISNTPFKVTFEGDKEGTMMFFCGQTFMRPSLKEQYLLLVHADK